MSLEDIFSTGIQAWSDVEVARADSTASNPVPNVRGSSGASTRQGQSAYTGVPTGISQIPVWGWAVAGVGVVILIIALTGRH